MKNFLLSESSLLMMAKIIDWQIIDFELSKDIYDLRASRLRKYWFFTNWSHNLSKFTESFYTILSKTISSFFLWTCANCFFIFLKICKNWFLKIFSQKYSIIGHYQVRKVGRFLFNVPFFDQSTVLSLICSFKKW